MSGGVALFSWVIRPVSEYWSSSNTTCFTLMSGFAFSKSAMIPSSASFCVPPVIEWVMRISTGSAPAESKGAAAPKAAPAISPIARLRNPARKPMTSLLIPKGSVYNWYVLGTLLEFCDAVQPLKLRLFHT